MLQGAIAASLSVVEQRPVPESTVFGKWFWHTSPNKLHLPGKTNGPFDSREDAIGNAKTLLVKQLPFSFHERSDEFYVGRAVPAKVELPVSVDEIIEDVRWGFNPDDEGMFDPAEWMFNVPAHTKTALSEALDQTFRQWMIDNNLLPSWYSMEEVTLVRCYET